MVWRIGMAAAIAVAAAGQADAAITVYQGDLAGFNAAAGNPGVAIDFESLSGNLAGQTVAGVTFASPDGNTLDVVNAADTVSYDNNPANSLIASSGRRVLSPGGTDLAAGPDPKQADSLDLRFAAPTSAFGLDLLYQSLDIGSYTNYAVYGAGDVLLTSGYVDTSSSNGQGGDPAGNFFIGFVSSDPATAISRVVFTDFDSDATYPDSNIGYDTLRFATSAAVPEPASWAMMIGGLGFAGGALRRRGRTATALA